MFLDILNPVLPIDFQFWGIATTYAKHYCGAYDLLSWSGDVCVLSFTILLTFLPGPDMEAENVSPGGGPLLTAIKD